LLIEYVLPETRGYNQYAAKIAMNFSRPGQTGNLSRDRLKCEVMANNINSAVMDSGAVAETLLVSQPATGAVRRPELLAPAGDWECARAAVENGADAIYFGLDRFNARMRAQNFTEADLPKLMEFLHRRGVKGYVTFNTLVFAHEMADAEQFLRALIAAGVDAAIVQDVGICRLIRMLSPDFPIHASTQMTITSAAGMDFARQLGCCLVVLARECSIQDIGKINRAQSAPLPLEVFVHGALCVAYSGQCLTSEALGGRSANRGECAQACRMPYDLICDGQPVPLGDRRYLLSPQDLAGLEVLPDLIRAGVASLKIEGRLKSPEYVANITRVYRQALDKLRADPAAAPRLAGQAHYDLEMAFSRGLHTGWFGGVNNQRLVHARFGKKRGVFLGTVRGVEGGRVFIHLEAPLKAGDGIVFDSGRPDEKEEGGRVYHVVPARDPALCALDFGRDDLDFSRIHIGDRLWKTSDPELDRRLRQSFAGQTPHFRRPLSLEVHGRAAGPMTLIGRDEMGHVARVESSLPLAVAENQPLTTEKLREQLGRLGGTVLQLGELRNFLEGEVILPASELNRMRRELAGVIEEMRAQPRRWKDCESPIGESGRAVPALIERRDAAATLDGGLQNAVTNNAPKEAELIVLVRNLAQLEAALGCDLQTIYCEFEDPKKYREAVHRFRQSAIRNPQSAILVAPPRIFKPGEEWILKQVRSCEADGWLIRNYDHLQYFTEGRRVGDFSLNIANPLAADYFKNEFKLERLTASYDLNIVQLEALLQSAPPAWFEITIHQHMPMFHMEHCLFCAFLTNGTDYTNCGRPCDKHDVQLRDRVGLQHPLMADAGCRNTVFNGRAQTGAEYVARLMALGARRFRIEFVNENAEEVKRIIASYRSLLRGEITGGQLWRELKLHHQLGVTRGPMEKG
jgi:putative protease